jgi:Myosin-crossreactive antigen
LSQNGSITESSTQGSPTQAAPKTSELGGSWKLWQNLAKQSEEFGHPDVFCKDIPKEAWVVSATVTWKNLKDSTLF